MTEEFDIWDSHNEIVLQAYQGDNYQCFDTGVESDICYILFSSNGLYYPNTREVFEEQILKKDRYEWKWVVQNSQIPKCAARIIYVRDIYKEWYSRGINSKINSIEKTLEFLKALTEGYRVITVGSSAGGYMAVLSAIKLNAEYCINFSGQYLIGADLGNPFYNLTDMLDDYKGKIFYFVPARCDNDKEQYRLVEEKKCVKIFFFNESKHASTMLIGNMSYIINMTEEKLLQLHGKYSGEKINKIGFLFSTVPLHKISSILFREIKGFLIRKSGKHWNGV